MIKECLFFVKGVGEERKEEDKRDGGKGRVHYNLKGNKDTLEDSLCRTQGYQSPNIYGFFSSHHTVD